MPMSMWDIPVIMGVAKRIHPNVNFFSKFFNKSPAEYHYSDLIVLDEEEESLLITPYVHPNAEAPTIRKIGYESRYFEPTCIKDKGELNATDGLVRMAGEDPGNLSNASNRIQVKYYDMIKNAKKRYMYRLEEMAAQIIKNAQLVVHPDKGQNYVINFARHADLKPTLQSNEYWSDKTTDIMGQIEDWAGKVLEHSGGVITSIAMGTKAYAWMRGNEKFKELYNLNAGYRTNLLIDPEKPVEGIVYKGKFGEYDIYVHSSRYKDPHDNQTKSIVAPNEVVLLSSALKGNRHFAVIKDLEAGLRPMDYFMKSWEKKEPSSRFIKLESHPLLLLKGKQAVNGAMTVKVGA